MYVKKIMNDDHDFQRMNHLEHTIKRSFESLSYDQIARQMERHQISSYYTPDRIIELFRMIIGKEREVYIEKLKNEIRDGKDYKKELKEKLYLKTTSSDAAIQQYCEENTNLRKQLNALESNLDDDSLRSHRSHTKVTEKINKIQRKLNAYLPLITRIHSQAFFLSEQTESIRDEIIHYQKNLSSWIEQAKSNVLQEIKEAQRKVKESMSVDKLQHDLKSRNSLTMQYQETIERVLNHVPSIADGNTNVEVFKKSLVEFVKSKRPQITKSAVKSRLEMELKAKEDEFKKLLQRQNRRNTRLQKELESAQMRFGMLVDADSTMDKDLLAEIENSRLELHQNQAQTDKMMKLLKSKSSDYSVSSEISVTIPDSPRPAK